MSDWVKKAHPDPKCQTRIAATCAAAIECEHGYDCCPICDPCTCRPEKRQSEKKPTP